MKLLMKYFVFNYIYLCNSLLIYLIYWWLCVVLVRKFYVRNFENYKKNVIRK